MTDSTFDYAPAWRASSFCASGQCVEVAQLTNDRFALRDSKHAFVDSSEPIVELSQGQFEALLDVLARRSTVSSTSGIDVQELESGDIVFRSRLTGVELRFDLVEIDAFVAGIRAGEFTPEALMQPVG